MASEVVMFGYICSYFGDSKVCVKGFVNNSDRFCCIRKELTLKNQLRNFKPLVISKRTRSTAFGIALIGTEPKYNSMDGYFCLIQDKLLLTLNIK